LHASPSKTGQDSEPLIPGGCTNSSTGVIGDFVFNDLNANGLQEAGEPGLSNVKVSITGPNNYSASTTTGTNGLYQFTGLAAGKYTVSFATPTGYNSSPAKVAGNDAIDSDPVNGSVTIDLAEGATNKNVDAGFYHRRRDIN